MQVFVKMQTLRGLEEDGWEGRGAHLCGHPAVHILGQVRGQQVDGGGPHAVPAQGGVVLQAITGAVLGPTGEGGSERGRRE